ncbi:unnamed protein product [Adineta ricciae]|uniref:Uncharacterized protein n=1 Tax=Adineta ricciae TaxID=249248 RepID=A0A815Y4A5_ADIRI|nr:unnamed protein product [Adineta ricciae]
MVKVRENLSAINCNSYYKSDQMEEEKMIDEQQLDARISGSVEGIASLPRRALLIQCWAENVLSPSISEDCLLLLDSCSGQTDPSIYDDIFIKNITCKQMQIPPKTTDGIQPLDRYFFDNGNISNKRFMIEWPLIK